MKFVKVLLSGIERNLGVMLLIFFLFTRVAYLYVHIIQQMKTKMQQQILKVHEIYSYKYVHCAKSYLNIYTVLSITG